MARVGDDELELAALRRVAQAVVVEMDQGRQVAGQRGLQPAHHRRPFLDRSVRAEEGEHADAQGLAGRGGMGMQEAEQREGSEGGEGGADDREHRHNMAACAALVKA
ncbi:MAG: hypothetical protein PWP40_1973 [Rhodocyclaceae bacterium]|nr:hypothetical protein [Rhodocyclaceae bacterium]